MFKYGDIPACVSAKREGLNVKSNFKSQSNGTKWLLKAQRNAITVTANTFKPVSVLILRGRRVISLEHVHIYFQEEAKR